MMQLQYIQRPIGVDLLLSYIIPRALESAAARPKKLKNPHISVTVVSMIEDEVAGS
jgi:hypothetical protein